MSNRNIFEDVSAQSQPAQPVPSGLAEKTSARARRAIRAWLMLIFGMVVAIIAVGGLTRLTDSGLSITEWDPISGALPPLSATDWATEFEKYRASPEYINQNSGMSLAEFKYIFWWEWAHRQLARMIGLVWAMGLFVFWFTGLIPRGWATRLIGIGVLGGVQGAIGWWMVSSGLTGRMIDVASYRLAIHLALAFTILGLIAWYILQLGRTEPELMQARRQRDRALLGWSTALLHLSALQIILGALVAGIDAGRGHTDWPLMLGRFFPEDAFTATPLWWNFFENAGLVQFNHRMVGYALFVVGLMAWIRSRKSANDSTRRGFDWAATAIFGQMVLGIVTLLYAAPLGLGLAHQLGAVIVWVLVIRVRFLSAFPLKQVIRGA